MAVAAGDLPYRMRAQARELLERADAERELLRAEARRLLWESARMLGEQIGEDEAVGRVTETVCGFFRVDRTRLISKSRIARLARARHVWMYLLRQQTLMSYPRIAAVTQRDHSTVIYAVQQVERQMRKSPAVAAMVEQLSSKGEGKPWRYCRMKS